MALQLPTATGNALANIIQQGNALSAATSARRNATLQAQFSNELASNQLRLAEQKQLQGNIERLYAADRQGVQDDIVNNQNRIKIEDDYAYNQQRLANEQIRISQAGNALKDRSPAIARAAELRSKANLMKRQYQEDVDWYNSEVQAGSVGMPKPVDPSAEVSNLETAAKQIDDGIVGLNAAAGPGFSVSTSTNRGFGTRYNSRGLQQPGRVSNLPPYEPAQRPPDGNITGVPKAGTADISNNPLLPGTPAAVAALDEINSIAALARSQPDGIPPDTFPTAQDIRNQGAGISGNELGQSPFATTEEIRNQGANISGNDLGRAAFDVQGDGSLAGAVGLSGEQPLPDARAKPTPAPPQTTAEGLAKGEVVTIEPLSAAGKPESNNANRAVVPAGSPANEARSPDSKTYPMVAAKENQWFSSRPVTVREKEAKDKYISDGTQELAQMEVDLGKVPAHNKRAQEYKKGQIALKRARLTWLKDQNTLPKIIEEDITPAEAESISRVRQHVTDAVAAGAILRKNGQYYYPGTAGTDAAKKGGRHEDKGGKANVGVFPFDTKSEKSSDLWFELDQLRTSNMLGKLADVRHLLPPEFANDPQIEAVIGSDIESQVIQGTPSSKIDAKFLSPRDGKLRLIN